MPDIIGASHEMVKEPMPELKFVSIERTYHDAAGSCSFFFFLSYCLLEHRYDTPTFITSGLRQLSNDICLGRKYASVKNLGAKRG